MDAAHAAILRLAARHADFVIAEVAKLGRVNPRHLSPLRDLVFDDFLRMMSQLDENKTPTVQLWPEAPTEPPPKTYSETIKGMPTPLPEGVKGRKR